MNTTRDTAYCRLCAELKKHNKLKNLQTDEELRNKVVDKLSRFNIEMDFRETMLPKSVCLICVKLLERAFAFVTAVEQAQTFLSDVILVQRDTAESDSCNKNMSYKPPEYHKSTIVFKHEINDDVTILRDTQFTTSDSTTKRNITEHDIEKKHDIQPIYEIMVENTITSNKCESRVMTNVHSKDSMIERNINEHDNIQPPNEITVKKTIMNKKCNYIPNLHHLKDKTKMNKTDEHNNSETTSSGNRACSIDNIKKENNSNVRIKTTGQSIKQIQIKQKGVNTENKKRKLSAPKLNKRTKIVTPKSVDTDLEHIKMTWKDYEWKCSHCGTLFPNIEELQKHSMQYHNVCNPYQCTECVYRRSNLTVFIKHVRIKHNNDLLYSCYKCFKKFNNPHQSGKHKRIIHEDSDYVCLGCNTPFYNKRELTEHVNKYYNKWIIKTPNDLKCKICKKVTASAKDFRAHLRVHRDKKVFVCETCGKCYSSKPMLAEHMVSHSQDSTGKILHCCDVCDRTFARAGNLRIHKTIHTGIRAFTCDICGKSYRTKKYIANHMTTHMYPFSKACTVCDKKLRSATNLRNHMRQHTGEKPFSCTICKRDFADLCNRNKHMRRRHGIEMAKKRVKLGMPTPVETPPSSGVVENNLLEDIKIKVENVK